MGHSKGYDTPLTYSEFFPTTLVTDVNGRIVGYLKDVTDGFHKFGAKVRTLSRLHYFETSVSGYKLFG